MIWQSGLMFPLGALRSENLFSSSDGVKLSKDPVFQDG